MRWKLSKIVLVSLLLMVIAISALGTIARGFSFLTTSPTTISTAVLSPPFTSSNDVAIAKAFADSEEDEIAKVRAKLSEVIEKLKEVRDEVSFPSAKGAIDEVAKSLEDIGALLESVKAISLISEAEIVVTPEVWIVVNETLTIINETLSRLKELLDELRDDIEALKEAKTALTKIKALANILADKALEEAKLGNLDKAIKLAQKALNITNGVIDAYYKKAKVFETYARTFRNICGALARFIRVHIELVRMLYLYGFIGVQIQIPEEETIEEEVETKEVEESGVIYAKLGEPVRVGDWEITVLDVKEATYIRKDDYYDYYYRAKEGHKVIVVTLRIKNLGKRSASPSEALDTWSFIMVSNASKSYERVSIYKLTPIYYTVEDIKSKAITFRRLDTHALLAPGTYIEGDILFQIPEDEEPVRLHFKAHVFFEEYEITVELKTP